ncbi:MAG: HNH endonuclease [Chloroflexi bacterium]|nr:HNH endonuclease [Chloroflexota bacterium]
MSKSYIPRSLRRQTIKTFGKRCAYCHSPTAITGARLVVDHIIPEAEGGQTIADDLCVACHSYNEFKGYRARFQDQITRETVLLFHPHHQRWREHFAWSEDGSLVVGLTPTGRATVLALNMNHPDIVEARHRWVAVGWLPPTNDL